MSNKKYTILDNSLTMAYNPGINSDYKKKQGFTILLRF